MEEIRVSQAPRRPTSSATAGAAAAGGRSSSKARSRNRFSRGCATLGVSLQESYRYLKATLVGTAKKMTARSEKEVTEADMVAAKMQVDAADAAENAKKKIHASAN